MKLVRLEKDVGRARAVPEAAKIHRVPWHIDSHPHTGSDAGAEIADADADQAPLGATIPDATA